MLSHEYAIVELDIVESLRNHAKDRDIDAWMNCKDAADEIERLREALSAMTELFKATEASAQFALSEAERLREQNELLRKAIDDIEFWVADSIAKSRAALGEKE